MSTVVNCCFIWLMELQGDLFLTSKLKKIFYNKHYMCQMRITMKIFSEVLYLNKLNIVVKV